MSYAFDLERSARGLRLNRFLHGLTAPRCRDSFQNEPEQAMQGLTEEEKDMVRRLDWKAMQDHGANFFCLEKLARVKGVSNPEIVAHFRGETLDEFLQTRRVPERDEMNGTVVRNIHRAAPDTIAVLERLGVATVHEAQGRTGLMLPYIRPLWRGARIAGSAVTALCHPGDNWMIHVACDVVQKGDVLVIACSSENTDGAFGELLATSVRALGVRGVVIDMGCRDSAEIAEMKLPLWSRAISAKGTVKASIGSVNVPVVCAGANVRPGDVIVADDDGVVVVPRLDCARVAQAGEERERKEAEKRARLQNGELGLDIYDMRKALAEKGLKYVDGPIDP